MALNKARVNNNEKKDVFSVPTEEIQMGINMSAIKELINRFTDLYDNPMEATIRETVSNAIDATVSNTGERIVEIISPSAFSAQLVVKDNGKGMSKEDVRNIYSLYGASTKATDLRQTGAYGLGAKAPLAYCSEFTIETTKDGETTTAFVTKQNDGNYVKIESSINKDVADGTVVTIPVREYDIQRFKDIIQKNYVGYPVGDVKIMIDGHITNDKYIKLPFEVTLDVETNTKGGIWVENDPQELAKFISATIHRDTMKYFTILSGWHYSLNNDRNLNWNHGTIYIELKPGVVNFPSSRDNITDDERRVKLEENITKVVKSEKFLDYVFKKFSNDTNLKEFVMAKLLEEGYTTETDTYRSTGVLCGDFTLNDVVVVPKEREVISLHCVQSTGKSRNTSFVLNKNKNPYRAMKTVSNTVKEMFDYMNRALDDDSSDEDDILGLAGTIVLYFMANATKREKFVVYTGVDNKDTIKAIKKYRNILCDDEKHTIFTKLTKKQAQKELDKIPYFDLSAECVQERIEEIVKQKKEEQKEKRNKVVRVKVDKEEKEAAEKMKEFQVETFEVVDNLIKTVNKGRVVLKEIVEREENGTIFVLSTSFRRAPYEYLYCLEKSLNKEITKFALISEINDPTATGIKLLDKYLNVYLFGERSDLPTLVKLRLEDRIISSGGRYDKHPMPKRVENKIIQKATKELVSLIEERVKSDSTNYIYTSYLLPNDDCEFDSTVLNGLSDMIGEINSILSASQAVRAIEDNKTFAVIGQMIKGELIKFKEKILHENLVQ